MKNQKIITPKYTFNSIYTTKHSTTDYTSLGFNSSGRCSTGDESTGDFSTGNRSTGNRSTGLYSTGYSSTGHCSTGDYSTGNHSTGNWSISNRSTGHFSTINYSGFSVFDKPCSIEEWDKAEKPKFLRFKLTRWIDIDDMTDKEKEDNPTYKTTEGYLKVYTYKEAWLNSWSKASDEDKELLYRLPNFDATVFKEISGIDVTKDKTYKGYAPNTRKNSLKVRLLRIPNLRLKLALLIVVAVGAILIYNTVN